MPESRKDWTPFRRREEAAMVGLLIAGELLGITVSYATLQTHPDLSKAFAAGSVTLLFGALLGGIVSQLVAEFDRQRVRRAAELEFIGNVLADLKSVYDQVDRGRTLIVAHQSVKTYGDEMRAFIEARVKLRNVERALSVDERQRRIASVYEPVHAMTQYLNSLTEEFELHFKALSRQQSVYEAEMKLALARITDTHSSPTLPPNTPWERLVRLSVLADFIAPAEDTTDTGARVHLSIYGRSFLANLDEASRQLRDALIGQLENRASAGVKPMPATMTLRA
jgi:hypothetical protein